jgi:MFS family permease
VRHRLQAGMGLVTLHAICMNLRIFAAVLPLYGFQLGMTATQIGVMLAINITAQIFTGVAGGSVADLLSWHREVILVGTALTAGAFVGLALWPSVATMVTANLLCGIGAGFVYGNIDAYARLRHNIDQRTAEDFEHYHSLQKAKSWLAQVGGIGLVLLLMVTQFSDAPRLAATVQAVLTLVALAACWLFPRLPRAPRPPSHVDPRELIHINHQLWPIVLYCAIVMCLSNVSMLAIQLLSIERGFGGVGVLVLMAVFWLCSAVFGAGTMLLERWLGARRAPMGVFLAGVVGLLVLGLAPGSWALGGLVLSALVTGCQASMQWVRITQITNRPATLISVTITATSVMLVGSSLLMGWVSDQFSAGTACLVMVSIILPAGVLVGQKAWHVQRGW